MRLYYIKIYNLVSTTDSEKESCMSYITKTVQRFDGRLYAFCLLPTHQHFLLEIYQKDVQSFVDEIHRFYARKGLCCSKSELPDMRIAYSIVERNFYAARVSCFIHALPVLSGMATSLDTYHWSSYSAYTGYDVTKYISGYEIIKAQVIRSYLRSGSAYKKYVMWFIKECFDNFSTFIDSGFCIGSKQFRKAISDIQAKVTSDRTHPKEVVTLDCIDEALANYRDLPAVQIRLLKIYLARIMTRLSNKQIAVSCGDVSVSRISQLYGQSLKRYSNDPVFRGVADEITRRFRDPQYL